MRELRHDATGRQKSRPSGNGHHWFETGDEIAGRRYLAGLKPTPSNFLGGRGLLAPPGNGGRGLQPRHRADFHFAGNDWPSVGRIDP